MTSAIGSVVPSSSRRCVKSSSDVVDRSFPPLSDRKFQTISNTRTNKGARKREKAPMEMLMRLKSLLQRRGKGYEDVDLIYGCTADRGEGRTRRRAFGVDAGATREDVLAVEAKRAGRDGFGEERARGFPSRGCAGG